MKPFRALSALLAGLALVLGPVMPALAAEVVTASVTPGITILSSDTLVSGLKNRSELRLPNGYAPVEFANGTGVGQVSVKYAAVLTLAASTPQTLDLTALTGGTGAAAFAKAKVLGVYSNDAANGGKDVIVGGGATNPFVGPLAGTAPTYTVKAGCAWVHFDRSTAGMTVDGTHKLIKFDPGSNACSITVVFAGN